MNPAKNRETNLKTVWSEFRVANPKIRIRDVAKQLGVSEMELLATGIGENVVRLNDKFDELLHEVHKLGYVMALTRNEQIVHERKGVYENAETGLAHKMALFVNPDIDLRIFLSNWHFGFAVTSDSPRGTMRSLQFFDIDGTAVHKIFLTETSDLDAYSKLVADYKNDDQSDAITIGTKPAPVSDLPDSEIDVEGFRAAWTGLKDTHDFFPLMRIFKVGREQALRLADPEMAVSVPIATFRSVLEKAAARAIPIMVFVGNRGIIQIHTGEIENVVDAHGWINIMDEKFNLHVDQSGLKSAWIVKKPTSDGVVTSLELFNNDGENVALLFGKRKPGVPEMTEWRDLLNDARP